MTTKPVGRRKPATARRSVARSVRVLTRASGALRWIHIIPEMPMQCRKRDTDRNRLFATASHSYQAQQETRSRVLPGRRTWRSASGRALPGE